MPSQKCHIHGSAMVRFDRMCRGETPGSHARLCGVCTSLRLDAGHGHRPLPWMGSSLSPEGKVDQDINNK